MLNDGKIGKPIKIIEKIHVVIEYSKLVRKSFPLLEICARGVFVSLAIRVEHGVNKTCLRGAHNDINVVARNELFVQGHVFSACVERYGRRLGPNVRRARKLNGYMIYVFFRNPFLNFFGYAVNPQHILRAAIVVHEFEFRFAFVAITSVVIIGLSQYHVSYVRMFDDICFDALYTQTDKGFAFFQSAETRIVQSQIRFYSVFVIGNQTAGKTRTTLFGGAPPLGMNVIHRALIVFVVRIDALGGVYQIRRRVHVVAPPVAISAADRRIVVRIIRCKTELRS